MTRYEQMLMEELIRNTGGRRPVKKGVLYHIIDKLSMCFVLFILATILKGVFL